MNLQKTLESLGLDLLQSEAGAPVCVRPRSVDEAKRVVRACRDLGVRVAPAGLDPAPEGPVGVVVDLSRFDALQLNDEGHLVTAGAGVAVSELERTLREQGLTLGLGAAPGVPLGAWLAAAEPGPLCARSGPATTPVAGLEAVTLDGTHLTTRPSPRRATGPALEALLVGGGGRTGLILGATLRVHARGALMRRLVHAFPDYAAGLNAAVEAFGRELTPDRFGLLDGGAAETALTWEIQGEPRSVGLQAQILDEVCTAAGGRRLSTQARTGADPDPSADPGAAGPAEVAEEAVRRAPDQARFDIVVRWSRVLLVRRALLERVGSGARLDLVRALPEAALALVGVPTGREDEARAIVREVGAHLPGEPVPWFSAVGALLEGGKT